MAQRLASLSIMRKPLFGDPGLPGKPAPAGTRSVLLWAVSLAFATGLVLGGHLGSLNTSKASSEAPDEDEMAASSFVAANSKLRQTIIDLRRRKEETLPRVGD